MVVEFIADTMAVTVNTQLWQVATNFVIAEVQPEGTQSPCWRYNLAYSTLEQANGSLDGTQAMNLLSDVSVPSTIWSVVYHQNTGAVQVAIGHEYDTFYDFQL